uniref:Peroxisome biogenesis factor 1-like n=1 Tax=Saccoglossus kowalevskii TaxID=10224 RepID=A0ABM0MYY3_SACKO|nr:PREDICTED: peroxisome biogenesis factor 1-like [Saccoglossus kowalevskii]
MTSPKVASIEYNSHCKTCFITLPASLAAQYHRVECAAFELQWANDCQAYMSWGGEITRDGKDEAIIEINGLYANKLGLPNGQEVLLKPLCSVPSCSTANIEPLSVDDWEILELHAGYIESQLLSQLRIVWPGQVFPVWINKNICIFMKIDQIMPTATCYAKLEQHTEVIVAPKSRLSESFNKPTRHQHQLEPKPKSKSLLEASTHGSVANGSMDGVNSCSTLRNSELPGNGSHGKERLESVDHVRKYGLILENGRLEWSLYPAWYASKIFNYVRKIVSSPEVERNETKGKKEDVDDDEDVDEEIDLSDVDLVVRVHPMCDSTIVTESLSRPPSYAQQLTQQALSKVDLGPLEADPSDNYSHLMQPTTVFVKRNTLLNAMASEEKKSQVRMLLDTDHCSFLALLTRLSSPKERMEEMRKKILDNEEKSKKKETVADEKKVAEKKSKDPEKIAEQQSSFVVRIIVYNDEFSIHSGDEFKSVSMVPSDYLQGDFVQVQDLLRRQLNLEVTSKVWLHGLKHEASNISSIQLQPFTKLPEDIKKEEILYSFQHWLTCVSCMIYPLPVSQETLVRFPVSRAADIYAEFMLFVKSNTKEDNEYFLLHPFIARKVTPSVNLIPYTQPVTLPRMPCNSVSDIDSTIITPRLRNLGGVNDIGQQALDHLRASLNIRPLANYICKSTSGLLNGGLLIYGPKGSGKSSLGRALCRELHEWPYLCHCVIIECKQLKGKRVESIRKIWEEAFREAFWREPAIILLDDLDHVTSAPLGPEEEVGPEAVYNTRIAQCKYTLL